MNKARGLVVMAVAAAIYGCSDSSSTSSNSTLSGSVTLSGKVGTGYQTKSNKAFYATSAAPAVNSVWAVPVDSRASDTMADFEHAVKATISSGTGDFELALRQDKDYVLLLMDTTAGSRRDQIVSYVSLADTSSTLSLLYLPISEAQTESLDVGTLDEDAESGDAQSQALASAEATFNLTLPQLLELASVDDTFKTIKNQFVNQDPVSGINYDLQLGFTWFINYAFLQGTGATTDPALPTSDAALPKSHPANVDLSPTGWYSGYSLGVSTNRDLAADNVCPPDGAFWTDVVTEGGKLLSIYPPEGATNILHSGTGQTYNDAAPIQNEGGTTSGINGLGSHHYETGCMDADMALTFEQNYGETRWRFGLWGDDYLEGPVPDGEWVVKLGDNTNPTELAWFDVAASYPFDADGKPLIYLPVPRVVTDPATHKVTAINIGWVRWNGTAYVAADPAAAQIIAGNFYAGVSDGNVGSLGNRVEGYVSSDTMPTSVNLADLKAPGAGNPVDPTLAWYFNPDPLNTTDNNTDTGEYHIETLAVGYEMAGVSYSFAYRNRPTP